MVYPAIFFLAAIRVIQSSIVTMEFGSPCGQVSFLSGQASYLNMPTRSRTECAKTCATHSSCLAFNSCGNGTAYSCEMIDYVSASLDCNSIQTLANCSFKVKTGARTATINYTATAELSLNAECPVNSYQLPQYHACYWKQGGRVNVTDGKTACQNSGGQLSVITNEAIMVILEQMMMADSSFEKSSSAGYWIGINDIEEEDMFVTQFGRAPWKRWMSGQPNDAGDPAGDQDCIVLFPDKSYTLQDKYCTQTHYPFCFKYLTGDGYRHVYTIDGNHTFGSVAALEQALQNGEDIRVLIHEWQTNIDILINVDHIQTTADGICTMSAHSMKFQQITNLVHVIVGACTNGVLVTSVWWGGVQKSTSTKWMTWFSTDKYKSVVYASNDQNLPMLESAIQNGSDIVMYRSTAVCRLHDVYYDRNFTGQFAWQPSSNDTSWYGTLFDKNAQMYSLNWDTGVTSTMNTVGGDFRLLAGNPWNLVFVNDASGARVFGWISDLITYIQSGHRIKVDYDGHVAEVDVIFIKSYTVTAVLTLELGLKDADTSKDTWTRVVTILSTSGTVKTYEFYPSSAKVQSTSQSTETIKWFVDVAMWTAVHMTRVGRTDNFSTGTVTLLDVFNAGQPVRIRADPAVPNDKLRYSVTVSVDNVIHYKDLDQFQATFSRSFSVTTNMTDGSYQLNSQVICQYFRYFSNGDLIMSSIPNGQSVISNTQTLPASMWWFSQPYIF